MPKRKSFSAAVEAAVLFRCRRRCAFCYGLENDLKQKDGQLAHIDRNPANNAEKNAAYLCTKHHAQYDMRSRQTKGLSPGELRMFQRELHKTMSSLVWPVGTQTASADRNRGKPADGITSELYDRRIPVYRKARQFVDTVLKDLQPDLKDILQFARDTDEALFLFDEGISDYLAGMFKQALRLRTIALTLSRVSADERTAALRDEENSLTMWFSSQPEEIRRRFTPFLRLA